jgi:hypothetical protein
MVKAPSIKMQLISLKVYFSGKHAALRKKSKDWSARNQDNVSEWDDITIKIQLSVLV